MSQNNIASILASIASAPQAVPSVNVGDVLVALAIASLLKGR